MKKNLFSRLLALLVAFGVVTSSTLGQSYYDMTLGDYTENFSTITNTNVWVTPSTGSWQGLATNATGTIPSATRITAQSTNFVSSASGGVQRGANSTLQFLSTGSTDNTTSTAIDLLLNFTGRNAGSLGFDAATVFNSTGNRVGTLRVYYTTDGSTWGEITGGGLPYVATNNVAGSAVVNVSLPAAINEASATKLRFYYNNGTGGSTGSRPKISIANLIVTSTPAVAGAPVITSPTTASVVAYANTANVYQITASNSPNSYAATGLPEGLSIDTATGIISGTATIPGVYPIGITATNAQGTGGATLTLTVTKNPGAPTITSALTATGLVGDPTFSYQITADNAPTSFSSGTLPAGLTLASGTGLITGTPSAGGTFNVPITASNALGSDTQTLVITINSPPFITSPTSGSLYITNSAGVSNSFSYTITASFSPTSRDATGLPEGWTVDTATGVITNNTAPLTLGSTTFGISATNPFGSASTNYSLKVFDQAMQDAVPLNVVVNKYVNGNVNTGSVDKVQLLVVGNGTAGSVVDMRGMIIKDFSGSMASDNGGKYIFTDNAVWSAVPSGTLVTLSAGTSQTEDIDPADYYLAVNLGNANYFTDGGGTFDISTTDMLMLKSAGSGVSGVAGGIHTLAGGTAGALFNTFTGAKLRATGTSGADLGVIALNSTSQLSDYGASGASASSDASGGQTAASMNFASWNNAANETYILSLRGSGPVTPIVNLTGSPFSAFSTAAGTPSAAQTVSVSGSNLTGNITITPPAGYQVSSDGITFSSSVSLTPVSGSVAATTISVRLSGASAGSFSGDVSFASTGATTQTRAVSGTVTSAYDAWATSYSLTGASALPTADPDNDGLNNNNEYAFGTNPTVANASLMSATTTSGNMTVSWIERNSGFTYAVQSTTNLATTAFANDGSFTPTTSGNQAGVPSGYTRKQFNVPASSNKFFRVRATAN